MPIFNLAWLIPLFPLLAFVASALFAHRSRTASLLIALAGVALAFVLGQAVFWTAVSEKERLFQSAALPWLAVGQQRLPLGIYMDAASAVMLFVVPLVGLLVFVYGAEALQGDPRYNRFFACSSLLVAGAVGLAVLDNLLAFFICWAIIDFCVYLLAGLAHERKPAREAALWAFLVNGVGNLCLLLGLALLWTSAGSLAYGDVFGGAALERLAQATLPGTSFSLAATVALLLLGGIAAKSAQFPLHVWLAEATEAPAPASTLVHAVAAATGVFLLVRAYPLFDAAASGLFIPGLGMNGVAMVGLVTAVLTALFALAQRDIRRALSFSAVSQLGYVVAALGLGAYAAGVFHLAVTVIVMALLFLAAGSVAQGMALGQQAEPGSAPLDPHDMLQMGGLRKQQKDTFLMFLIGALTLAGLPFVTAGFWSKDAILMQAWSASQAAFWLLAATTGLTAFSAMRQVCLIFVGPPRSSAAARAPESPPTMTAPLAVLALLALGLGVVAVPPQLVGLGGVIPGGVEVLLGTPDAARDFVWETTSLGIACGVSGLLLAFLVYAWRPLAAGQRDRLERLGFLYRGLRDGLYLDRLYRRAFGKGAIGLAGALAGVDGALSRLAEWMRWLGRGPSWAGAWFEARVLDPLAGLATRASRGLAQACAWPDAHILDALVHMVGRAGRELARASDALERRTLDRLADWVATLGRGLARACAALDPWLDRLASLAQPGTLALVRLSDWTERGVALVVDGVGGVVKAGGLAFRARTGKVQSYLLLASVAVLVLVAVFLFL
jgi:NADH-quinone oxidoreductase subunit L